MRIGLRLAVAAATVWGGVFLAGTGAGAQQAPIMIKGQPYTYDPDNAKDVMRICGGCHGELGNGGGGGQYPRLAGINADYLADQMRKFKTRERENIPMIPFAVDRELSEADVLDVTRYLSDAVYKTGWDDGFMTCKGDYDSTTSLMRR